MKFLVELTMMRTVEADTPQQAKSIAIEPLSDSSDEWGIIGTSVVDVSRLQSH